MNYIKHLTCFYEKLAVDDRLNPNHISLYLALFQCWNLNHFQNPVSINRSQVLKLSKIGSNHTYYKVLNDLNTWGFIKYSPSLTPSKGSQIIMCIFAPNTHEEGNSSDLQWCNNAPYIDAELHPNECKNAPLFGAILHPSLNNININNKTVCEESSQTETLISETMKTNSNNQSKVIINKFKRKKVAQKKEKPMQPPELNKITPFFKIEGYSEMEARKFFNHFESNGWKVGGKSPMKNWHAAARNWMLNIEKFNPAQKKGSNVLNKPKNYGEPL